MSSKCNEAVVRLVSAKKQEPPFLLDWRLKAYRHWQSMPVPEWSSVHYPPIDYNAISYYSSPKSRKDAPASLEEVDPKLLETYAKLGIPLEEQEQLASVAVDAVFDHQESPCFSRGQTHPQGHRSHP